MLLLLIFEAFILLVRRTHDSRCGFLASNHFLVLQWFWPLLLGQRRLMLANINRDAHARQREGARDRAAEPGADPYAPPEEQALPDDEVPQIDELPKHTLTQQEVDALPDDKKSCSICLESYIAGSVVKTLLCLHLYHEAW